MAEEKRATVRDIAKKAGVSVATVSYVLNDKQDTKISESTRKKVLQIANLLNYSIPQRFKGDDGSKGYTIGIIYKLKEGSFSRNAEIMKMIHLLAERLGRMEFRCHLIPVDQDSEVGAPVKGLDGIIAIDLDQATFKKMSGNYFIPILCLDMMINDFLFYQIHTDFESITPKCRELIGDDYVFMMDGYCNEGYQQYIESVAGRHFLNVGSGIDKKVLVKIKNKKVIAYGEMLGIAMLEYVDAGNLLVIMDHESGGYLPETIRVLQYDMEKKANLSISIMMNALEKKFDVKHEYKV